MKFTISSHVPETISPGLWPRACQIGQSLFDRFRNLSNFRFSGFLSGRQLEGSHHVFGRFGRKCSLRFYYCCVFGTLVWIRGHCWFNVLLCVSSNLNRTAPVHATRFTQRGANNGRHQEIRALLQCASGVTSCICSLSLG